jgi:hypothetical protein
MNTMQGIYTTNTTSPTYTVSPGSYMMSNGTTSGVSWVTAPSINSNLTGGTLQVKGDAEFEGDIKIKGKSLNEMFEKIEERLAILHPNPKLEDKWDELKELGKRYKELELSLIHI